ncbi:hypothetical protein D3C85_1297360 [compost metagenome]
MISRSPESNSSRSYSCRRSGYLSSNKSSLEFFNLSRSSEIPLSRFFFGFCRSILSAVFACSADFTSVFSFLTFLFFFIAKNYIVIKIENVLMWDCVTCLLFLWQLIYFNFFNASLTHKLSCIEHFN